MKISNLVIAVAVLFGSFSAANAMAADKAFEYTCVSADGVHTANVKSVPNNPFFANEAFSPTVYTTIKNRSTRETRKEKLYDGWYEEGDYMDITYEGQTMFARYISKAGKVVVAELFCASLEKGPEAMVTFEIQVPAGLSNLRYVNGIAVERTAKNPHFPDGTKLSVCTLSEERLDPKLIGAATDSKTLMKVYDEIQYYQFEFKGRSARAKYSGRCFIEIVGESRNVPMTNFSASDVKAVIQRAFPRGMVQIK